MTVGSFADLGRQGVERFLQTVLVIDNELTLDAPAEFVPTIVVPPAASLRGASAKPDPAPPASPATSSTARGRSAESPLDAKQIMDAFLRRSLICGMHKPNRGDELVAEAIRAARRSDAVIVDWMLDGKDPRGAKEIIAGIVEGDRGENGRLRLIVVYTSEQNVMSISTQISERLSDLTLQAPGAGVLTKSDLRIVVMNKEGTVGGSNIVPVAALPARIVEEFAHLTKGVLATFAVSAIAAVRRSTHHVLAVFSDEMDGAFLGHMCALKSPEDALDFALDLLGGELRGVASMNPETAAVLSPLSLGLHIDALATGGKLTHGQIEVPLEHARLFPEGGLTAVKASAPDQRRSGTNDPPSKRDRINELNVGYLFHCGRSTAEEAHERFARLASFRTEMFDRTDLPASWVPTLTLGTLVRRIGEGEPSGYLLCTQPRCDALRLDGPRRYPFQTAVEATGAAFNLVAAAPDAVGAIRNVKLVVKSKPCDALMLSFAPTGTGRVQAARVGGGPFEFVDADGNRYLWIGDLREMTAQRAASSVAARLHEVGIDEFEWLRFKGVAKIED